MSHINSQTLKDVHESARYYYLTQRHDILVKAYRNSGTVERQAYPDAVRAVAEIGIFRGDFTLAGEALGFAYEGYSQQGSKSGLAHVLIARAHIARHESQITEALKLLDESREMTLNDAVHGAADYLQGEILMSTDTDRAMDYYMQAWKCFRRAVEQDPLYKFDMAQVGLRIANIAYMQGMDDTAKKYREDSMNVLAEDGTEFLTPRQMMQLGHEMMQTGDFGAAWQYIEKVDLISLESPAFEVRVHAIKAYLAWLSDDESMAAREVELSLPVSTDDRIVIALRLLVQGYLSLSSGDYHGAQLRIREAKLNIGDNLLLKNRFQQLSGCIKAMFEQCTDDDLAEMQNVLSYYRNNFLRMEVIQCLLICGWLATLLRRTEEARNLLQECVDRCWKLGGVAYIYRLFQLAYPHIVEIWGSLERVERVQRMMVRFKHRYENGINGKKCLVYAFDKPRLAAQQNKRGPLIMKYVLYLLERGEATRDELLDLLYPGDRREGVVNKFNVLRASVNEVVGDWAPYIQDEKIYRVISHFPGYYDVREFKRAADMAQRVADETARLIYYERAIEAYRGHFAEGVAGDFFDARREEYQRIYCQILKEAISLADAQGHKDLSGKWWAKLGSDDLMA